METQQELDTPPSLNKNNEDLLQLNKQEDAPVEEEQEDPELIAERAQRYDELMKLLNKSDAYVRIIQQRMKEDALHHQNRIKITQSSRKVIKKESTRKRKSTLFNCNNARRSKRTCVLNENIKETKEDNQHEEDLIKNGESSQEDEEEEIYSRPLYAIDEESSIDNKNKYYKNESEATNLLLFTGGLLRQYQRDGYIWIRTIYENAINGILADEMGLGKTVQIIATICMLLQKRVEGPFLIVAPLSTIPNWKSEFARFAPLVPIVTYHGSPHERKELAKIIDKSVKITSSLSSSSAAAGQSKKQWTTTTFPVILTTYEMVLSENKYLSSKNYKLLVVDEGHRLKNFNCQLVQRLRNYSSLLKILLTGTPLQNQLHELWSLLNFILPEIFSSLSSFECWFDTDALTQSSGRQKLIEMERQTAIVATLHRILQPFVLRRLKSDINLALPPKREIVIYTGMTQQQVSLTNMVANKTIELLLQKSMIRGDVDVKNIIASTDDQSQQQDGEHQDDDNRRLVRKGTKDKDRFKNYWHWFNNSDQEDEEEAKEVEEEGEEKEADKIVVNNSTNKNKKSILNIQLRSVFTLLRRIVNHPYLVEYPLDAKGDFLLDDKLITSSGKMIILDKLLTQLKAQGHRVLIFSQWTSILDVIQDYLNMKQWEFARLDGSCSLQDRMEQLNWFSTTQDAFCFLLTTGAGGLGLNLTAADTAIIFDSSWNPQVDLQAQDRCHRIGQDKPVLVFRLVCGNSVDERMFKRACGKRSLERLIIHDKKFKCSSVTNGDEKLSLEELMDVLQRRDQEADMRNEILTDDAICKLLKRSALVNVNDEETKEKICHDFKGKVEIVS